MSRNQFLDAVKRHDYLTENGAVSHSTSGNALVDYFAKCGTFRNRAQKDVFADMSRIWAESPKLAMMIVFYLRMVTRGNRGFVHVESVQKGQGARDEFRKAIGWIAKYHGNTLNRNLWLIPEVGVWKDLWHADLIDVLNRNAVYDLVRRGMADEFHRPLVAKYLPRIRSRSKRFSARHEALHGWSTGLMKSLGWTAKDYRLFKSNPENSAHEFQRLMSAGAWNDLDFKRIPGRALFQLTAPRGSEGETAFARHGQEERYLDWIQAQPAAKFTGYVYELFRAANARKLSAARKWTLDRQFDGLIEMAKQDQNGLTGNVWTAIDTSGSMQWSVAGPVTAYDVCVSLGIYFSTLNEGAFRDHVVAFDDKSRVIKLAGSFTDKANQINRMTTAWGSTNFQSVIDEIVRVRVNRPEIPLRDFPDTLLVVSDMQFNPVGGNTSTNYERAMAKLATVGLPKMRIIWWWVTGRRRDFPSTIQDEGVTMIGGFDGAVVSLILGGETEVRDAKTGKVRSLNAYENMLKALDQDVLRRIKI